ncbi:MAG: SDR family oxidoreductase [Proteobacteria bacterium]|nr:SDR family oxidoreductase [Pseudomonadota bacterium]
MNLGIAGRRALVCASSKGLGKGCAMALAAEGVHVTLVARMAGPLTATAEEIRRAHGVEVQTVAADITTPDGQGAALAACREPDILVNNAGGPPPGDFRNWTETDWQAAVNANMVTPIMLIRATIDRMIARNFGRIVNITSGAVKAPVPLLGLSTAARAGLTGFVASVSREVMRHNVTINNLLPGPFETERMAATLAAGAKRSGQAPEELREERRRNNPAQRFGTIEEFGAFCAFLCSVHAGYVTGQNVLIDGGAYPGVM